MNVQATEIAFDPESLWTQLTNLSIQQNNRILQDSVTKKDQTHEFFQNFAMLPGLSLLLNKYPCRSCRRNFTCLVSIIATAFGLDLDSPSAFC